MTPAQMQQWQSHRTRGMTSTCPVVVAAGPLVACCMACSTRVASCLWMLRAPQTQVCCAGMPSTHV
jgi:hypothetical protein